MSAETGKKDGSARDRRGKGARARSAARLAAVQALYQMDLAGTPVDRVVSEFETYRFGAEGDDGTLEEADPAHFGAVVRGVVERQAEIDRLVNGVLAEGWPLTRIDATLRALFRAAAFELISMREVPVRVVISEYLDVAHAFYDGDEPGFVNGVLDAIARKKGLVGTPGEAG